MTEGGTTEAQASRRSRSSTDETSTASCGLLQRSSATAILGDREAARDAVHKGFAVAVRKRGTMRVGGRSAHGSGRSFSTALISERDASSRELARREEQADRRGIYPCEREEGIDLGDGQTICP